MVKNQIIYIIGFMGSGKSTAGKQLASLLGWTFIDLDKSIEEYTGKTITEIFSQNGESYFRNIETQLLRSYKAQTHAIISTGGGTPCADDNMDFMLGTGLTLYLKLTPGQLNSRLSESKGDRPLLKDLNQKELLHFIEEKLADRERWYNRSDIVVDGNKLDISLLHPLIVSRLNN